MVKSRAGGLFGSLRPGAVTLVEPPVSRAYARRARVTFYAVTIATLLTTAVVVRHWQPAVAVGVSFGAGLVAGIVAAVAVVVWPVVRVLWHWSVEVGAGLALLGAWVLLSDATSNVWAALILAALAGGLFGWPGPRRRLWAFVWCGVIRHRLRLCFAHLVRTGTRSHHAGSLPLILLARPTPAGARVWVWLRPGLDLAELDGKASKLAVACWAAQVRVTAGSERHAALLRIDVARRDPLAGKVSSPLPGQVPTPDKKTTNRATDGPALALVRSVASPAGLDLDEVPELPPAAAGGRR